MHLCHLCHLRHVGVCRLAETAAQPGGSSRFVSDQGGGTWMCDVSVRVLDVSGGWILEETPRTAIWPAILAL